MLPDEELCLCFHVTRRKVENFIRVERPKRDTKLSECFGAGTGCGWCRPLLRQLFLNSLDATASTDSLVDLPSAEDHAGGRREHIHSGHGRPPAGTQT